MHDLRHRFASFGAANGLSLPIIGALLGHKNTSTTQRYAHRTDIAARQAANDVSDMVAAALVCGRGSERRAEGSPSYRVAHFSTGSGFMDCFFDIPERFSTRESDSRVACALCG